MNSSFPLRYSRSPRCSTVGGIATNMAPISMLSGRKPIRRIMNDGCGVAGKRDVDKEVLS